MIANARPLFGACILVIGVVCSSCAGSPTEPTGDPTAVSLPLARESWQTISDPQPFPLRNEGTSLVFDFPDEGSMHYLFTVSPIAALRGTVEVTLEITAGTPVLFQSLDPQTAQCSIASSVRPFLWANDNGSGSFDRWWSNPRAQTLAAGRATISVPLAAENWSSVNGRFGNADSQTRFAFDRALLNVTRLGLTFGGGCSFGHGIRISGGAAKFALAEYVIR